MKLYFTTSGEADTVQSKPTLSLGGYKSSSPVPNNILDNLFGELSLLTIKENRDEYIGLIAVNESGAEITGCNIYFVHPEDSYSEYKIAAILPATDGDGNNYIESIPSRYSKPLYSDCVSADIDNKYSIGTIANGSAVGIWIKRELLVDFIQTDSNDIYETDPDNIRRYIAKNPSTQDSIQIIIEWD